jgi:hypothetical protein
MKCPHAMRRGHSSFGMIPVLLRTSYSPMNSFYEYGLSPLSKLMFSVRIYDPSPEGVPKVFNRKERKGIRRVAQRETA